jgi:hypothetical protein
MKPSAQLTSGQLKEVIQNTMKTNQGAREVQEQEEDGVVGKRLLSLQSHTGGFKRDWVRIIGALHHAIDKVEKPSLDHHSERPH